MEPMMAMEGVYLDGLGRWPWNGREILWHVKEHISKTCGDAHDERTRLLLCLFLLRVQRYFGREFPTVDRALGLEKQRCKNKKQGLNAQIRRQWIMQFVEEEKRKGLPLDEGLFEEVSLRLQSHGVLLRASQVSKDYYACKGPSQGRPMKKGRTAKTKPENQ